MSQGALPQEARLSGVRRPPGALLAGARPGRGAVLEGAAGPWATALQAAQRAAAPRAAALQAAVRLGTQGPVEPEPVACGVIRLLRAGGALFPAEVSAVLRHRPPTAASPQ